MPAKQLSPLCEFEVHLSPNIFGLSVPPLHALPFALLQSVVQRCQVYMGMCKNHKGRAAGQQPSCCKVM